jgi:hypothetical protein
MADLSNIALYDRDEPVVLASPAPGNYRRVRAVRAGCRVRAFIDGLGINPRIPDIVQAKFARAQTSISWGGSTSAWSKKAISPR